MHQTEGGEYHSGLAPLRRVLRRAKRRRSIQGLCTLPTARHEQVVHRTVRRMAARLGLEPRQNESESFVLPLHHRAVKIFDATFLLRRRSANLDTYSNLLKTGCAIRNSQGEGWSRRWDSNPQPPVYKTGALPLSYAGKNLGAGQTLTGKKHETQPARQARG